MFFIVAERAWKIKLNLFISSAKPPKYPFVLQLKHYPLRVDNLKYCSETAPKTVDTKQLK